MVCDLSNLGIGDIECEFIAKHDGFDNLAQLYLELNKITAEGVRQLAHSRNIANLRLLSLDRNKVGDEGIRYIVGSENLQNLAHLMVEYNEITAECFEVVRCELNL